MKRLIDLVVSGSALLILSPLLLATALLIRWQLGSPVLFRQVRPGLNARPFEMIKFRTMVDANGSDGRPLPDAQRMTALGRFLRASSIDELPELVNVIRGEMSLVGPRPLRVAYLALYSSEQARRHEVRPGITGWAQVNGRNSLKWADKFELDVWYVDHHSIFLDLKIIIMTFYCILRREGVAHDGYESMYAFRGNADE